MSVDIAIISNEPTPYRLHVLRRIARELEGVRVHNVFTHRLGDASMPWQMQVDDSLRPVFFPELALKDRPRDWRRAWRLYERIRDYLLAQNVRLVVLLGYNDLTRLGLLRWGRRAGVPVLLSGDSNVFSEGRLSPLKRAVKRRYVRWVVGAAAGLMPMGTCGRAYFRLYADHHKPEFLFPYEPDYSALQERDEQAERAFLNRHKLDPDRPRMLYCGRLVPVKQVDVLLRAFARVAAERPTWDLVIAGDGPIGPELQDLAGSLGLEERAIFLGFLQFSEARACYHCCQLLIHPSGYEPWGVVINEAVACGLAVIATSVTGAAVELVRNGVNGLLVPPGDVTALEQAIRSATQPQVLRQMQSGAGDILKQWREGADPVEGLRAALRYWDLI